MSRFRMRVFLATAAGLLAFTAAASAFKVVKNINDGKPPVEKVVIFKKGQNTDHLQLVDKAGKSEMGFTKDGAIEIKITGNKAVQPTILWKAIEGLPETVNLNDYNYLLLTYAVEGDIKRTFANGRTSSTRGGNLWFPVYFYDGKNVKSGTANPADYTEDKTTPKTMTELKIPLSLMRKTGAYGDITKINGFGLPWGKTHDYNDRNIRVVIEKIVLAD